MDKKVCMRMCVGCRTMREKRELVRLVRLAEGTKLPAGAKPFQAGEAQVLADRTGKASGRGAYVCPSRQCLQKARKTRQFERALHIAMSDELFDLLAVEVERHQLFGTALPGQGVAVVTAQDLAKTDAGSEGVP